MEKTVVGAWTKMNEALQDNVKGRKKREESQTSLKITHNREGGKSGGKDEDPHSSCR